MAARHRTPAGRLWLLAAVYAVLVFILLPSLIVVPMSFGEDRFLRFPPRGFTLDWYSQFLTSAQWQHATWLSLRVAVLVAFVATIMGCLAAIAMTRGRIAGRGLVNLLLLSPLVVPNIVIAIAVFLFLARLGLTGSVAGFVLAHTILALPFVVLTVSASLLRLDSELELAALILGASRLRAFRHVTLPLILPGVLSGFVFAFITSFDEPVISFFISGPGQTTLPRRMFEDVDQNITPVLAAVASILSAVSLLGLAIIGLARRATLSLTGPDR